MKITWLNKNDLFPEAIRQIKNVDIVLDIGCGIMPQPYIIPKVHICCEPFQQYVEVLQERLRNGGDSIYVVLKSTWADAVELFPAKSVDTVFLVDVIEHLEKEEAIRLLKKTESLARQQIAVFTPLGYSHQHSKGDKDAWGLDGAVYQEHRSGWIPEDFGGNWSIFACKYFHDTDNVGNSLEEPFGAFWAIWEGDDNSDSSDQKLIEAPNSLWMNYQLLQQEHYVLQQEHNALLDTRAVKIAKKVWGHPLLNKLSKMVYDVLSKRGDR